jgi:hypothetical protein
MPANYVLLEKITVGAAGASSVTFASIPQTGYTDLVIKATNRTTSGGVNIMGMTFNGSTTGYTFRNLEGTGSAAGSGGGTSSAGWAGLSQPPTYTANTFSSNEIYIPNYASSNNKSWSVDSTTENNATASYIELIAGLWSNTAAITSIALADLGGAPFAQYSTFYLYGVAKLGTTPAIVPYATGGDTIMTDGTYWYHAFLSSGTFTPAKGLSCDVLVVAGGGGGGWFAGGGGGAGGLVYLASQGVSTSAQTITVGAGGSAVTNANGTQGSNSQFASLTAAVGGGYGGGSNTAGSAGGSGGSGGGAGGDNFTVNPTPAGGTATSGQGSAGGSKTNGRYFGAGGGGASAAGVSITSDVGGNGGNGSSAYSSWGSVTGTGQNVSGTYWYAGGGGGNNNSTGGNGGGGYVNASSVSFAATANTGGGGGGAANGGSGLVIVRYAV